MTDTRLPLLIYDGDCAFCTRSAEWIAARWTTAATAGAWQQLGAGRLSALGLSVDDVQRAAFWIDTDRRTFRGHRAVARALECGTTTDRLIGHVLLIPPVSWLARPGYWLVARYRHRLPGATAACRGDNAD